MLTLATVAYVASSPGQSFLISVFVDDFLVGTGLSRTTFSALYAGGTVVSAVSMLVLGRVVDRRGLRVAWCLVAVALAAACGLASIAAGAVLAFVALALLRTAGGPTRAPRRRTPPATSVRPTIQRLLDAMPTAPAVVLNGRLDVLAMNALGRTLFSPWYDGDGPVSNARLVFLDPRSRTFFREWDVVADDTVALLRAEAGRDPFDRALTDLVGELSTRSDDFRVRWASHDVRIHNTGIKKLRHPVVGDLDLPFESLPVEGGTSTALVTYLPEPGSSTADALAVLASWAAPEGVGSTSG